MALEVIEGLFKKSGIEKRAVQSLFLGSPLMHQGADLAQSLAAQAGLQAQTCTLSNHQASGYRALQLGISECEGQKKNVLIAHLQGPSEAPYILPKARWGQRFGECELLDSLELEDWQDLRDGASAMLLSPVPDHALAQILTLQSADCPRRALSQSLKNLGIEGEAIQAFALGPGLAPDIGHNVFSKSVMADHACPIRQIQMLLDRLQPQSYGCALIQHQGCYQLLTLKTL